MTEKIYQTDLAAFKELLAGLLQAQVPEQAWSWIQQKRESFEKDFMGSKNAFLMAFSGAPRFVPKDVLQVDEISYQKTQELRPGIEIRRWTIDQTTRCLFLLHIPHEDKNFYLQTLEQLFNAAEMNELVALYASLPLFVYPQDLSKRAAEGIRTNMSVVFDAVALENPYSTEYLDQNAWNQLYLKAAFMARPLYRIHGIDQRANAELARIISDYAHERWAAGREISPEFWRPVAQFLDERLLGDLKKLLDNGSTLEQQAAALVCSESKHPEAKNLLAQYPDLQNQAVQNTISWLSIAQVLNTNPKI
ncbi:MAG: EboA domain-containing protein [Microscillaceae bacterium]|nr:EboA domain-containing protein [Microscillaceae bacterium]